MYRSMTRFLPFALAFAATTVVRADAVTDWNARAADAITTSRLPSPFMYRTAAIVQVAVFEAANAITARYRAPHSKLRAPSDASIDAAVAAATRAVLVKLVPGQEAALDTAYRSALQTLPEGPAKTNGIAAGEKAAAILLESRADDGSAAPDVYRPHAAPGAYVPTTLPVGAQWGRRKPWIMTRGDQFRPGPPPALGSETWKQDYNEIARLGSRNSTQRSAAQTEIARFWEAVTPAVYFSVVRSVAVSQPGSDVTQNARLLAIVAVAMDDAMIAVLDAKYAYNFWRPITAVRNGDLDRIRETTRDASWAPLIDTPMHPEYPCAHCILAATVGTVLQAAIGAGPTPRLTATSPAAPGVVHTWSSVEDFIEEVAMARIYAGVHYRNSTRVGMAMGRTIGELAWTRYSSVDAGE